MTTAPAPGFWPLLRYRARFGGYLLSWLSTALLALDVVLGTNSLIRGDWRDSATSFGVAAICGAVAYSPMMRNAATASARHLILHRELAALLAAKVAAPGVVTFTDDNRAAWVVIRSGGRFGSARIYRTDWDDARNAADVRYGYQDQAAFITRCLSMSTLMPVLYWRADGGILRRTADGSVTTEQLPKPEATRWRTLTSALKGTDAPYYAETHEIAEAITALRSAEYVVAFPPRPEDPA